ncbi:hypothetical protein [Pseudoxanthomonas suwonensis]|uniref:Lectin n=1 Tax=Pseudoxanthomonas suwonensis TaxID=314722 RepID=A0A0E3Z315_9GAMM|nr:hypothetical protein [Pseudoxanthomonas suwonensis]AKC87168.1 hypothetical protein WQ53_10855 [Pseudoxanthomonas suwonensis]
MPSRTTSRTLDACLLTLALVLASCSQAPDSHALDDAATADAEESALDEPVEEIPPATVPDAAVALAPLAVDFSGFGPVPFGSDAQALRQAWDRPLEGGDEATGDACHYLLPQPRPAHGYGIGFMVEDGRFVRVDVDDPSATAPGGGRIGMTAAEIAALYPGRVEERLHKYVEGGRYLRVAGDSGAAVLLFETDAQGRVQEWRVGLPPQVDYVEGCS